jgi:hypothetical protein
MQTTNEIKKHKAPDVQERLEALTSKTLVTAASLPGDKVGETIADLLTAQILGAFYAHGTAEGSPGIKEFAQNFRETLANLRKLRRTVALLKCLALPCNGQAVREIEEEADILVRIFFSSLRTLEGRMKE